MMQCQMRWAIWNSGTFGSLSRHRCSCRSRVHMVTNEAMLSTPTLAEVSRRMFTLRLAMW